MNAQDLLTPPQKYRLKVADYLRLHDAGAFEGLRTELIEGDIIVMSPQTARHIYVKTELGYRLRAALEALGSGLFVGVDGTIAVDDSNLPEPDIFVTDAISVEGYVPASSVKLAVEVAVTSLDHDLRRKQRLYAQHGIPEYWVADAAGGVIHRMWSPDGEGYVELDEVRFGEPIAAATIAGLAVETSGL